MVKRNKLPPKLAPIEGGRKEQGGKDVKTDLKLHLALDQETYAKLNWLKGNLQAASFSEVVRRALQAYEIFEPDDEGRGSENLGEGGSGLPKIEHVYIPLTTEMKEHLDREKSAHGRAYRETISQSLRVLLQIVRERSKVLAEVRKGGVCDVGSSVDDHRYQKLAASF